MKTVYTIGVAEQVLDRYIKMGGEVIQFDEGVLGVGSWICTAEGKKSTVIKEVYINAWSSGQSIRSYNKLPKKYQKILDKL